MIRRIFERIAAVFGRARGAQAPPDPEKPPEGRSVDFHEDDYCQIEILPLAALEFCRREIEKIDAFSKEHFDGVGWTAMYMRKEQPHPFSELALPREEMIRLASSFAPAFDNVTTGYSTVFEPAPGVSAFGNSNRVVLYFECTKDGTVGAVWLQLNTYCQEDPGDALRLFSVLAKNAPLILVDWGWSFAVPLGDVESLSRYLEERFAAFRKAPDAAVEFTGDADTPQ